jgi:hypothetical protein
MSCLAEGEVRDRLRDSLTGYERPSGATVAQGRSARWSRAAVLVLLAAGALANAMGHTCSVADTCGWRTPTIFARSVDADHAGRPSGSRSEPAPGESVRPAHGAAALELSSKQNAYFPFTARLSAMDDAPASTAEPWRPPRPDHADCVYDYAQFGWDEELISRSKAGLNADSDILWLDRDSDGDGVVDGTRWTVYRSAHQPLVEARDDDNDGVVDALWLWRYDRAGRLVRDEYDSDADGRADEVRTRGYDAAGNLSEDSVDTNGDGTYEYIERMTYDSRGRLQESRSYHSGNDVPYRIRQFYYDGDFVSRVDYDDDADGVVDEWVVYSYSDGLEVSREWWQNGSVTERVEYRYDGRRRRMAMDLYSGRVWERREVYEYDDRDRLTKVVRTNMFGRTDKRSYIYHGSCAAGLNWP